MSRRIRSAALLAPALLALAALSAGCGRSDPEPTTTLAGPVQVIGDQVRVRADDGRHAEIGPDGALRIDAQAVALTPEQRAIAARYREQALEMGRDGAAIGQAGAELAKKALGQTVKSVLTGGDQRGEQQVADDAAVLEAHGQLLCDRLDALYREQQALTAQVPAFAPFATLKAEAGERCRRDH